MNIERSDYSPGHYSGHPTGWDPYSDPLYYEFHKYFSDFHHTPNRENARRLYDLMLGKAHIVQRGPFDAIASYIQPRNRQDAFILYQNALWALHDFIYHPESDSAMARMWLNNFRTMMF